MIIKSSLLAIFLFINLQADNYKEFYEHLENDNHAQACLIGKRLVYQDSLYDENLVSKVANSCLKSDYINILGSFQSKLTKSEEARTNSVIISSIILQKRLLYQFMHDNADISNFNLPLIDHPLSHAFIAIRDKEYKLISKSPKSISFDADGNHYRVYIQKTPNRRIVIEIKDKNNNIEEHRYK